MMTDWLASDFLQKILQKLSTAALLLVFYGLNMAPLLEYNAIIECKSVCS